MTRLALSPEQRAFVEDRLDIETASSNTAHGPTEPVMLLWGTVGYACYLAASGTVWVNEEPAAAPETWRPATELEAGGAVVKALDRFPGFRSFVPPRPIDAQTCDACGGRGGWARSTADQSPIWCSACHALGWVRLHTA